MAGYQRSCSPGAACTFGPAWTDDNNSPGGHDGCDTRNQILAADLTQVAYRAGSRCVVASGLLADPYTGSQIRFTRGAATSAAVQIDHVTALELAFDLGAHAWTQQRRTDYANDPLNLLAVDAASNIAKQSDGPAEWMPPNRGYWCSYDQRIVTVLTAYALPVVAADKNAMTAVLAGC